MSKFSSFAKNKIKNILDSKYCSKLSWYYRQGFTQTDSIYKLLLTNNNWIYTLPKTGTGYVCNVIAFYNALNKNNSNFNFDNIHEFGVLRGIHTNLSNLRNYINRDTRYKLFIHSHKFYDVETENLIITSRNILDQLISNYFFSYKNKKNINISINEALDYLISSLINTYYDQKKAIKRSKKFYIIKYEKLITDPYIVFSELFFGIYGKVDEKNLLIAIEKASVDNLKSFEKDSGRYMYGQKDLYTFDSFIRSGKIGEGEETFTKTQKKYIFDELSKHNISNDYNLNIK